MVRIARRPRTSEFPFTMLERVEPRATFMSQSKVVMGVMERLDPRRRSVKRKRTAREPITSGCRIPALM